MRYNATVAGKKIKILGASEMVRGNVEVDVLRVSFDEEWAGMERIYAVFWNEETPVRVPVEDGECLVPWEALEDVCQVWLTFVGYDDQAECRRIVTQKMEKPLDVVERGYLEGEDPKDPTPDAFAEIESRLADLEANSGGSASLPEGGTEGQVLTMTAEGAAWQDPQGGIGEEADILEAVVAAGLVEPVAAASGEILTDEDGKIYSL